MTNKITVNKWVGNFINGDYSCNDVGTQCNAGWYDWFCNNSSLARKTKLLGKKVIQLLPSKKIDGHNMYVWFKNNCTCQGNYDDFRFADIKTGEIFYTIALANNHYSKNQIWGRENNFEQPILTGSWKEVKEFFGI